MSWTRSQIAALLAFATVLSAGHGALAEALHLTAAHLIDTAAGRNGNEIGIMAKAKRPDIISLHNSSTVDVKIWNRLTLLWSVKITILS